MGIFTIGLGSLFLGRWHEHKGCYAVCLRSNVPVKGKLVIIKDLPFAYPEQSGLIGNDREDRGLDEIEVDHH